MKYYYPVLVEKKEDYYYPKYPGLENYEIDDAYDETLDDVFENVRYAMCGLLCELEDEGKPAPVSLETANITIPDNTFYCRFELDTDWYREEVLGVRKFSSNPFV